jgi:hypothetical protein
MGSAFPEAFAQSRKVDYRKLSGASGIGPRHFTHRSRRRLVQPVVEFVGGEGAAFVEQFADGGKVCGCDGIAGTITPRARPWSLTPTAR